MAGKKFTRINISQLDQDDDIKNDGKNDEDDDYIPLDGDDGDELDLDEYEQIDEEEDELDSEYVDSGEEDEETEGVDFGRRIRDYYQDESSSDDEFEEKVKEAKKLNEDLYRNVTDESADILNISAEVLNVSKVLNDIFKSDGITTEQEIKSPITLSSEDRIKLIEKCHPEFIALINDLHTNINVAYESILPLLNGVNFNKFCTRQGMEYLDLRNELILIYMTYFTYYMLIKVNGKSVTGHPVIERLLEIRLILDKIKPIESRLGYEISKLLELANNVEVKSVDTAKPELLVTDEESDTDSEYGGPDGSIPSFVTDKHSNLMSKLDKKVSREEERLRYNNRSDDESSCDMDNEMREFMRREKLEQEKMMRVFSDKERKRSKKSRDGLDDLSSFADSVTGSKAWEKLKANKHLKDVHSSSINAGLNTLNQMTKQGKIDSKKKFSADLMVKVRAQKPQVKVKTIDKHDTPKVVGDSLDLLSKGMKKVKSKKTVPIVMEDVVEGSRGVTHEILKNKGLIRKRKKGSGNARVKNKMKYEKRLKSIGKKSATQMGDYVGETTGINTKVKKSVQVT